MILPQRTPGIGVTLAIYGERELDQWHILRKVVKNGSSVLDIGANIGYYALLEWSLVGSEGKIYAFEPDDRNLSYLQKNIALNKAEKNIEVHTDAVSDRNGTAVFHLAAKANLNALQLSQDHNSEVLAARKIGRRSYVGQVEVSQRNVVDILSSTDRKVDLVRMDLEGHEVSILKAVLAALDAGDLKNRAPDHFLFEPHSWEYGNSPNGLGVVLSGLARHGYEIAALGTRDEKQSPIRQLGFTPEIEIPEKRGILRGVYWGLPQHEAVRLASSVDGVTTVLLSRSIQIV